MNGQTYFEHDYHEYEQVMSTLEDQLKSIEPLHCINCNSENKQNLAQFLRAKNAVMTKYLIQLNLYILTKLKYGEVNNVDTLLESKVLLQKMTQAQKKLQYQLDKLTKVEQLQQQQDEEIEKLTLKPRIDNLVQEKPQMINNKQKYVAPKFTAILSKEDQIKQRQERKLQQKKLHQKAQLIQGILNDQETDMPREIDEKQYQEIYYGRAEDEQQIEKRRYEEENMTRLPVTRDERRREKIADRKAQRSEIDNFDTFETVQKSLEGTKNLKNKQQGKQIRRPIKKMKGSMKKFMKKKRR